MRLTFLSTESLRPVLSALLHSSRGLAAVEFGLAAPILLVMMVGLVDFGLGFYDALQVQGAASAGAEYATLHAWSASNINTAVVSSSPLGALVNTDPAPFQVCACPTYSGGTVTNLKNAIDGQTVSATTGTTAAPGSTSTSLGSCSTPTAHTCTGCTTSTGTACPAGLYAVVNAQYSYFPMLPYPWSPSPLQLTGQSYRRLQ